MQNRGGQWVAIVVIPSYQASGQTGPIGWIREASRPDDITGTALVVGGAENVAREHSLSYATLAQTRLHAIDGIALEASIWDSVLLAACQQSLLEELDMTE